MDIEPKLLYSIGKPNNCGKLYGRWKVKRVGNAVQVEIYEHSLVEIGLSDVGCRTIEFDFDLKFAFSK
jgi:hypothetical protein